MWLSVFDFGWLDQIFGDWNWLLTCSESARPVISSILPRLWPKWRTAGQVLKDLTDLGSDNPGARWAEDTLDGMFWWEYSEYRSSWKFGASFQEKSLSIWVSKQRFRDSLVFEVPLVWETPKSGSSTQFLPDRVGRCCPGSVEAWSWLPRHLAGQGASKWQPTVQPPWAWAAAAGAGRCSCYGTWRRKASWPMWGGPGRSCWSSGCLLLSLGGQVSVGTCWVSKKQI